MLGIAVIGYGHWGPRIVRNFHSADGCKVVSICDKRASTLQLPARDFPSVETTSEFRQVLESPGNDAIAIVTPVWTHFELAEAALKNGIHLLRYGAASLPVAEKVSAEIVPLPMFPGDGAEAQSRAVARALDVR